MSSRSLNGIKKGRGGTPGVLKNPKFNHIYLRYKIDETLFFSTPYSLATSRAHSYGLSLNEELLENQVKYFWFLSDNTSKSRMT